MTELILPAALIASIVVVCIAWLCTRIASTRRGAQDDRSRADEQAETMLREILTEQEYQFLARHEFLEVVSPSHPARTYRVPRRRGQVKVFQDGVPVVSLCVQPTVPMPDADLVLMHKVLIEADEAAYLAVANRFDVRRFGSAIRLPEM
jgi:hypothetical protein